MVYPYLMGPLLGPIMKMSTLSIGAGASVGASAVVLYAAVMHSGATLGSLSLLMKGESPPAHTR